MIDANFDRDPGDGEGAALVPGAWHPSHIPAHMRPLPVCSDAIARGELDKARAILAKKTATLARDIEYVRAAFWLSAPLGVRTVVLVAAGMGKARAGDALEAFDAAERAKVGKAVDKLLADLGQVQRAMQGGKVSAKMSMN